MFSLFIYSYFVKFSIDHLESRLLDVSHEISNYVTHVLIDLTEQFHGRLSYGRSCMSSCNFGIVDCLFQRGARDTELVYHRCQEDAGLLQVVRSLGSSGVFYHLEANKLWSKALSGIHEHLFD